MNAINLTRKADVLQALQAGAYIVVPLHPTGPDIVYLFNANGEEIHAWQTALRSNLDKCTVGPDLVTAEGIVQEWRLKP